MGTSPVNVQAIGDPAVTVPTTIQTPKAIIPADIRYESALSMLGPPNSFGNLVGTIGVTIVGKCFRAPTVEASKSGEIWLPSLALKPYEAERRRTYRADRGIIGH